MITDHEPKSFDTKEELIEFSNNNCYSVNIESKELLQFISLNKNKFLYLRDANLRNADLTNADLSYADLCRVRLYNTKEIYELTTEYYIVYFTKQQIKIGCKQYSFEEWSEFTDTEISYMGNDSLKFWQKYKDTVLNLYKGYFNN